MMILQTSFALLLLISSRGAEACHTGRGPGAPCVLSTVSQCDTCQGLKCVNGVCASDAPVPPGGCHSGYAEGQPCQLAAVSQCNTCLGLKCVRGYCAKANPPPVPSPPVTPPSTCVTPVDNFDPVEYKNGPTFHKLENHSTPGWKSENAVDLRTRGQKPNPPVRAVEDGTICAGWCCLDKGDGQKVYGWQFTLTTASGQQFFYTHVERMQVLCGASVRKGQILAYIKNGPSVDHLHFAMEGGNPCTYLRRCTSLSGAPVVDLLQGCV